MKLNIFFGLIFIATVSAGYTKCAQLTSQNNVTFSFSAKFISYDKSQIEINGLLFNHNLDTLYFLSSSCDGPEHLLRFDSTKFLPNPPVLCYKAHPIIQKIPPNKTFAFSSYFLLKSNESKIKLGVDLYVISKSFDIKSVNLSEIYYWKDSLKNIIWAEEQQIK
jgi:hypothetical protein